MERLKKGYRDFQYKGILAIVLVFAVISVVLLVELSGIRVNYKKGTWGPMPVAMIVTKDQAYAKAPKTTLLLWDSSDESSQSAYTQFELILKDMKVGCQIVDLSQEPMSDFEEYINVIVLMSDLEPMGTDIITLCDWVYAGGNAMFPLSLEQNPYSAAIQSHLGIMESSEGFVEIDTIYVESEFMIGAGQEFNIPDSFESSRAVRLLPEKTKVHATGNGENGIPVIWEATYGNGKFVVDNIGIYDKAFRGFYAASFSLMEDTCVYPVINGSAFFLDDFPSQIPEGNSSYIERDYHTTIRDFYINIWWPDMMNIADKYGIKYTGLAIECYDDAVDGTTDARPDTGTFINFGNMLLRKGGEIGYHGYNHQPLCFDNCDYKGIYTYKTWENSAAMKKAFDHLVAFCDKLFPDVSMSVYVPPSNLLSKEGKEFLLKEYPQIQTFSGIYFEDDQLDFSLLQEFETLENGVVEQPRLISGCDINDFMKLGAFSELNFHFVNSHFTHPDDALDPDRGAELGWKELKVRFQSYLSWLYGSAPCIRNFTSSELSGAIQRFTGVSFEKEMTAEKMTIKINDFYDEAQFFVRFNEQEPGKVDGGKLTHLTGDLYLLEANKNTVTISFK